MYFEGGVLAAFGAMLFWGIGDFLIQRSARRVGDLESLAFICIIGAAGLLPFVLPELPLLFEPQNFALLLLVSVVSFAVGVVFCETLKNGKLSVMEVLLQIELPVTAVLGYLFFRETLSLAQLGMMALVFMGTAFVSISSLSSRLRVRSLERGILLAIITAVGAALLDFLTAYGAKQVSPLMVIWLPWVAVAIISMLFIGRREGLSGMVRNGIRFKYLLLAMGIIDTLAWLFYAAALVGNGLAVITAISVSYPAISVLLGVMVNKERIRTHQYAGATISLIASVLLALTI